jgi:hypothetical protein
MFSTTFAVVLKQSTFEETNAVDIVENIVTEGRVLVNARRRCSLIAS